MEEKTEKIKMPIETRVEAYNLILQLKKNNTSTQEIIKQVCKNFNIPYGTIYQYCKYGKSPFGKSKIRFKKELFYVLGALLGDGCAYYWKKMGWYLVILVGEKKFVDKFTDKLSKCCGRKIKGYIMRSKNVWKAQKLSIELYLLFKKVRENKSFLLNLMKNGDYSRNGIDFIEGLFDAEGCVKIIKEKVRKTPKICLDITNTDKELLDVAQLLLKEILNIESNYSLQKANGIKNKQTAYHLRIYKKSFIKKFFENIGTVKLRPEKEEYLQKWLNNGKGAEITSPLHFDNISQPAPS